MQKSKNYLDELEDYESEEERIKMASSSIWMFGLFKTEDEIKEACKDRNITYEQAMRYKDFWLK